MKIPRIRATKAGQVDPGRLRADGARLAIAIANWPAFGPVSVGGSGQLPRAEAWMAHTGDAIHLLFAVTEDGVRAANGQDQDPVWQDSCVELFIAPDSGGYYNFEFNCLGVCLSAFGPDRHQREDNPAASLGMVTRHSSLGGSVFGYRPGVASWELQVAIPAGSFFKHHISDFAAVETRINLFKCGDALPRPHYLSWRPITSAQPDFHRPECFGTVVFGE